MRAMKSRFMGSQQLLFWFAAYSTSLKVSVLLRALTAVVMKIDHKAEKFREPVFRFAISVALDLEMQVFSPFWLTKNMH